MANKEEIDSGSLARWIDPIRLTDTGATLSGEFPICDMKRLSAMLAHHEGMVRFVLYFSKNEEGTRVITGKVNAQLQLICQRCNKPMDCIIDSNVHLSPIVNEKQASSLAKDLDPLVTEGESIELLSIIEDEVILALPMIAKHEPAHCNVKLDLE